MPSGAHVAFIYVRGEYEAAARRLDAAITEARAAGFLGRTDLRDGFRPGGHRSIEAPGPISAERRRPSSNRSKGRGGEPRLKPPFPASVGLFRCPTVINNVETICNVPRILRDGAGAFRERGRPGDGGTRLFSVSGAVLRPGLYEAPVGTPI